MVDYISFAEMTKELNLYEYEIYTNGASTYTATTVLTGVTSGNTMIVRQVIAANRYFVDTLSGELTIGETIGTSGGGSNQSVLLTHDANVIYSAIRRVQSIIERFTGKSLLNQSTSKTDLFTTRKGKLQFLLKRTPVISITSITLDSSALTYTEDTDYRLDKDNGIITFLVTTIAKKATYRDNLKIIYTYGYNDTPANLQAALPPIITELMIRGVRTIWGRYVIESTAHGATSVNPAGFAISFNFEDLFTEDVKTMLEYEREIFIG